jgi:hypothetical protein
LLDFSNQTVLDPRVTFARTTTALFYDNKSAALAEQNLFIASNNFAAPYFSWQNLATPTQGATDPANGATAWTLTASAGLTQHYVQTISSNTPSIAATTYTASCYLQAGTNNFATLSVTNGTTTNWASVTFNLTSGSVGLGQAQSGAGGVLTYVASSVLFTQVGSTNWYRCSFSYISTAATTSQLTIQINNSATPTLGNYGLQNAWTAAGTETLLVYGAQLEQRSSPTVYTATTATAVNTYTPTLQVAAINAPRFDYNPTTRESLGLFTEQASTNLALYSSAFDNAAWTKDGSTITPTAAISPDGTQNAQLMVLSNANVLHGVRQTVTMTASSVYTVSVYAKSSGQQFFQIFLNTGSVFCNYDLIGGTAGTASGSGSPVGSIQNAGNGWYRCAVTFTASANSAVQLLAAASLLAGSASTVLGNGFNGYLIWGAQVELAPSATSYIATVASAQTRTVDSASMTGTNFTSWYNYSGGTVYVEAATGNFAATNIPYVLAIGDGTSGNTVAIYYSGSGVGTQVRVNSASLQNAVVALPTAIANNTFYKTAYYYSTAGTGVSSAGQVATTTSTSVSMPAANQINIANTGYTLGSPLNGRIKKFAYYPLPLTNTQIQSLSAN